MVKTGWFTEEKAGHVLIYIIIAKNVKGKKFAPIGLVSYIYFAPRGEREQRRCLMPLGLSPPGSSNTPFFSLPRRQDGV